MRIKSFLYIVVVSLFALVGCQSAVKSARDAGEGHFRARTLIEDKKTSKSFIVNLVFNIKKEKALRLDATSPLNQHLASFLIEPEKLSYFIVPEKVYYQGPASGRALARFFPVPIEPMWLENILFRKPFADKSWTCDLNKSSQVSSCLNKGQRLEVTWSDHGGKKLIIKLSHPKGEVQMNFHRIQSKVEAGVSLDTLSIPKGFRRVR